MCLVSCRHECVTDDLCVFLRRPRIGLYCVAVADAWAGAALARLERTRAVSGRSGGRLSPPGRTEGHSPAAAVPLGRRPKPMPVELLSGENTRKQTTAGCGGGAGVSAGAWPDPAVPAVVCGRRTAGGRRGDARTAALGRLAARLGRVALY